MAKTRLTERQKELLEKIQTGELRSVQTGDSEGNSVAILIRKGLVDAKNRCWNRSETTYWGRRIPGSMCFSGLFLTNVEAS